MEKVMLKYIQNTVANRNTKNADDEEKPNASVVIRPLEKKSTKMIFFFAIMSLFLAGQGFTIYCGILSATTYFSSIRENYFHCTTLNMTIKMLERLPQTSKSNWLIRWNVDYLKEYNRGDSFIETEATLEEKEAIVKIHSIGKELPCVLFWNSNNSFYFRWMDMIEDDLKKNLALFITMTCGLFILLVGCIAFIYYFFRKCYFVENRIINLS